jgi:hypothetical protein
MGVQGATPKSKFLLQYQPTITGYTSSAFSRQVLNRGALSIIRNSSERWKWTLNASGVHGQDGTRLLAPQQVVPIGEVPGTGSGSASYLPNSGTVTYLAGSFGITYRRSERDTVTLTATDSFNRTTGFNQQGSVATARVGYGRELTPRVGVSGYGQASHYYGSLRCESFGFGMGLRWQPQERTLLILSGGPQLNTDACGNQQGVAYSAAFSTRLSRKSQMYLLSDYQPAVSYLGPGLWQRSASGGYQRQVTSIGTVGVDLGYTSSNTLTAVSSYRGTFWSVNYGFKLRNGLAISYSYRGYMTDSGGNKYNRNLAQFSLTWSSNAGHIFQ